MTIPAVSFVKASSILEELPKAVRKNNYVRPDEIITNISTNKKVAESVKKTEQALNEAYTYGPTALINNIEFKPKAEYYQF